jgi:hypothetical protein
MSSSQIQASHKRIRIKFINDDVSINHRSQIMYLIPIEARTIRDLQIDLHKLLTDDQSQEAIAVSSLSIDGYTLFEQQSVDILRDNEQVECHLISQAKSKSMSNAINSSAVDHNKNDTSSSLFKQNKKIQDQSQFLVVPPKSPPSIVQAQPAHAQLDDYYDRIPHTDGKKPKQSNKASACTNSASNVQHTSLETLMHQNRRLQFVDTPNDARIASSALAISADKDLIVSVPAASIKRPQQSISRAEIQRHKRSRIDSTHSSSSKQTNKRLCKTTTNADANSKLDFSQCPLLTADDLLQLTKDDSISYKNTDQNDRQAARIVSTDTTLRAIKVNALTMSQLLSSTSPAHDTTIDLPADGCCDARLHYGPSYTSLLQRYREQKRADVKAQKWKAKLEQRRKEALQALAQVKVLEPQLRSHAQTTPIAQMQHHHLLHQAAFTNQPNQEMPTSSAASSNSHQSCSAVPHASHLTSTNALANSNVGPAVPRDLHSSQEDTNAFLDELMTLSQEQRKPQQQNQATNLIMNFPIATDQPQVQANAISLHSADVVSTVQSAHNPVQADGIRAHGDNSTVSSISQSTSNSKSQSQSQSTSQHSSSSGDKRFRISANSVTAALERARHLQLVAKQQSTMSLSAQRRARKRKHQQSQNSTDAAITCQAADTNAKSAQPDSDSQSHSPQSDVAAKCVSIGPLSSAEHDSSSLSLQ